MSQPYERLDSRKKKKKVVKNAARFFGFEEKLKREEFKLKGKEVFMISRELEEVLKKIRVEDKLVCAGIKVGEVGKKFRFTLEGAFFLAKKEKKKVYIDEKAEMLFLYGRDVFSSSIEKVSRDVKENDTVFVCNRFGDVIGIGRARFDVKEIARKGERVAVENLVDRGEYLRKEKLYASF